MTDLNPNYIWSAQPYPIYETYSKETSETYDFLKERIEKQMQELILKSFNLTQEDYDSKKENVKMCDCPTCKAGFGDMPKYSIGTEYVEDLAHIFSENYVPDIKSLIFNPPFSTVLWDDDTTTVSKTMAGDKFDPMVGFSICVLNKIFDSKNEYKKLISESWNYYQVKQEKKNQKEAKRIAKKVAGIVIQK